MKVTLQFYRNNAPLSLNAWKIWIYLLIINSEIQNRANNMEQLTHLDSSCCKNNILSKF